MRDEERSPWIGQQNHHKGMAKHKTRLCRHILSCHVWVADSTVYLWNGSYVVMAEAALKQGASSTSGGWGCPCTVGRLTQGHTLSILAVAAVPHEGEVVCLKELQ